MMSSELGQNCAGNMRRIVLLETAQDLVGRLFRLEHGGLQCARKGLVAVAAAALGLVEGDIGVDEDLGKVSAASV